MSRRRQRSPFIAGLIALIAVSALVYYGFRKDNPFSRPFHISAIVENSAGVKKGSLVRIAGVDVGKVRGVERYRGAEAAKIDMDIRSNGLPIHDGASIRIRPRLFLEGNFVLDLSPGSPTGRKLQDGDTIPLTRTSRSVQLDEVLSVLQGPERRDLQVVIQQLGKAFTTVDESGDPLTRGETAGQSLNDTIKAAAGAGRDIEQLARALQGQERGDLAAALRSFANLSAPLAANADELGKLIDGLDRTISVFADNSTAVRAGIERLPQTIRVADENLPVIRQSLEPIGAVSRNVTDGLDRVPGIVRASGGFLDQSRQLLSDEEAGGLVESLEPISEGLAKTAPSLAAILSDLDRLAVCTTQVLKPTADQVIQDGQYTSGMSVWDETLRGFVGLASAGQNFDANGLFARAATAQGSTYIGGTRRFVGAKPYLGTSNSATTSTRPARPANTLMTNESAPWKFDQPCTAKMTPNLSAVPTGPADGNAVRR